MRSMSNVRLRLRISKQSRTKGIVKQRNSTNGLTMRYIIAATPQTKNLTSLSLLLTMSLIIAITHNGYTKHSPNLAHPKYRYRQNTQCRLSARIKGWTRVHLSTMMIQAETRKRQAARACRLKQKRMRLYLKAKRKSLKVIGRLITVKRRRQRNWVGWNTGWWFEWSPNTSRPLLYRQRQSRKMGKIRICTQFTNRMFFMFTSISLKKLITDLRIFPLILPILPAQCVTILYTNRYKHHTILFCLTQTANNEQMPIRHALPTIQQQKAKVTKARLALSVQSRKLKKKIVGVSARFRERVVLFGLWSLNQYIFKEKTRKRLPKSKLFSDRIAVRLSPTKQLQSFCRQYSPGGVVILSSQTQNQFLQQCWNCRQ